MSDNRHLMGLSVYDYMIGLWHAFQQAGVAVAEKPVAVCKCVVIDRAPVAVGECRHE